MAITPFSGIRTGGSSQTRYVEREYSPGVGEWIKNRFHSETSGTEQEHLLAQGAQYLQQPTTESVHLKTVTQTMNHVNEYVIFNGFIWVKSTNEPATSWSHIGFPGICPVKIMADGNQLAVFDQDGTIYHKTTLKEKWKNGQYTFQDTSRVNDWSKGWFSSSKEAFSIPQEAICSLSERGTFNSFFIDNTGRRLTNPTSTVQLVVAPHFAQEISIYDPDLPKGEKITIPLPEKSRSSFTLANHSSSGSTIMVLGYQHTVPESNDLELDQGELTIYTLDFDRTLAGWAEYGNVLPTYVKDPFGHPTHILQDMVWKEHRLPESATSLTREISILQTGQGPTAREMRIGGTNTENKPGFFYKAIEQENWHFEPLNQLQPRVATNFSL